MGPRWLNNLGKKQEKEFLKHLNQYTANKARGNEDILASFSEDTIEKDMD